MTRWVVAKRPWTPAPESRMGGRGSNHPDHRFVRHPTVMTPYNTASYDPVYPSSSVFLMPITCSYDEAERPRNALRKRGTIMGLPGSRERSSMTPPLRMIAAGLVVLISACTTKVEVTKGLAKQSGGTTTPTLSGVTSSTANGSYTIGQAISIQVNFSEAVTVTGTPQLTLETGATDAVVNYVSGSGTSSLTFTYTIAAGHTSSDLDYQSTSALALNGGTIKDAAGNSATLTLATPGAANSLSANKSIVIETTAPTISAIASQSTDFNTPTSAISFTIGDVGSTIACNSTYLTLSSSDTAIASSSGVVWAGTYPNCTAVITPVSNGSGTASLTITVNDDAGNSATSVLNLVVRTAYVIGQPSSVVNKNVEMGLSGNTDTLIAGGKLFVADSWNHRILVWNTVPATFGQAPSFALGQPDLSSTTANNGGVSASSLNEPMAIYSDGTRLFVADALNHRVLVWNTLPTTSGQPADFALGQPNLTSNTANNGGSPTSGALNNPYTVRGDGTRIFVADTLNHRVLVWNSLPAMSGQAADFALGQPNLTSNTANNGGVSSSSLNGPWGITISGTKLFVSDSNNARVLVWNTIPTTSGQSAQFVLGQPNMTSNTTNNGGISGSTMNYPGSIHSDGTRLFVAEYNYRVLVWNTIPTTTAQPANFALGQPDLTSNTHNNGGVSGSSLGQAVGVFSDGTKLYVNDRSNARLLVWNTMPTSSGQAASFAIGQPDLVSNSQNNGIPPSATTLYRANSTYTDGTRLVVVDFNNNRVLIYNTIPTASGQAASVVLGQPDFTSKVANNGGVSASSLSNPWSAIIVGTTLYVADFSNNRVLGWNTIPTMNGQAADFVLGQPNLTSNTANNGGISGSSLNSPIGLYSDGTKLYVADTNNNRVLVWNALPQTNAQAANFAIGQASLTTNSFGTSATTMGTPSGIYHNGTKLFVADRSNNRVLVWNTLPTASGAAASFALGQPNLTSGGANNGGISGSTLSTPRSISSDGTKLYISDSLNNRILIWNIIPTTMGQTADAVYGQSNLTSNTANSGGLSAFSLWLPMGIFATATKLFIPELGNDRVLVIPAP
jgi:hypothetical protein